MQSRMRTPIVPEAVTLVLSNSTDTTTDYLCGRFAQAGILHRRFDTDQLLDALQLKMSDRDVELVWNTETLLPDQVSAIIYRRPKALVPPVRGDPFQRNHASDEWAEAIEGFLAHVPPGKWINHPTFNFAASHKPHQLTLATRCGLITPEWLVTNIPAEARRFVSTRAGDVIAKPLASGYIERENPEDDTVIFTRSIADMRPEWLDNLPGCPVLFQERIHKHLDVRVTVVDQRVVAVGLDARQADGEQPVDIRRDNMSAVNYMQVSIPDEVVNGIVVLMASYHLRFGAIDFAVDSEGRWFFLEINPNGQWAWLDLVGAADIGQLFVDALARRG